MLAALALVLTTQDPKTNDVAKDDRDILTVLFQDRSSKRYLGRKYWSERGTFWARIKGLATYSKPSARVLLDNGLKNSESRKQWDTICVIRENTKDDIEKAPPPVVPLLELGLSKDIRFTEHDVALYAKDQVKYTREISEYLRLSNLIDYPTPPAYSGSGRYAILTYRFSDIRHGWYSTLVFEKVNGAWKIILRTPSNWGRAD